MSALDFADRFTTTLASGYTSGGGSLSLTAAPSGISGACNFYMIVQAEGGNTEEVFLVSNMSGTTATVTGAQAGTSASNHGAGAVVIGSIMTKTAFLTLPQNFCLSGAIASLPSASIAGRLYFATDSIYDALRDNGSAWKYFYRGAQVTPPAGSWSWTNQGSSTATQQTNGVLSISCPSNGAADNLRIYEKSTPSTPWTRTFRLRPLINAQDYNSAGLALRESGTGKVITFEAIYHDGDTINSNKIILWVRVDKWNSVSSFSAAYAGNEQRAAFGNAGAPDLVLRITDNGVGSTLVYDFSVDNGINWQTLVSTNRNDFFTTGPDHYGIYANPNNQAGSSSCLMTLISED